MKLVNVPLVFSILVLLDCIVTAANPSMTTVTFRVLDEAGIPITNAWVRGTGYWKPAKSNGTTDNNGYFSYEDHVVGDIGCRAGKDGYYDTHGEIWPGPRFAGDHPTNSLIVILRKKINPIPMHSRHLFTLIVPRTNETFAFDFEKGDWVGPIGKGIVTDALVTAEKSFVTKQHMDLKVAIDFPNGSDGIQEFWARESSKLLLASDLMPPQEIPESGYTNRIVIFKTRRPNMPNNESWKKDRNYVYRVRSITNEIGKMAEANVGWIRRDFEIGITKGGQVGLTFNYYYNPDPHSRSLESTEAP